MIPRPRMLEVHGGECFLPQMLRYQCNGLSQKDVSHYCDYLLNWLRGEYEDSDYHAPPGELGLSLNISPTGLAHPEAYIIEIEEDSVSLKATWMEGFRHGFQSLMQLLYKAVRHHGGMLPCQRIEDWPAYEWRGLHLDCSRHFFGVDDVLKYLEWMEALKLNRFHWHLTDDQGWRIECPSFPLLTEKGAWRTNPDSSSYGGFYSRDDIARVVSYGLEMGIEVIPEIDLPGHAMAILSAYPELACIPKEFEPLSVWGISEDILCAGKDATLEFLKALLSEVAELFPGPFIHIGGDEAPKQRWKACPACQKRIKDQGLKDEEELQSWLIKELQKHLKTLGKTVIGWDEILDGDPGPDPIVSVWRGDGLDAARKAAQNGNPYLLCPNQFLYFDWKAAEDGPGAFGVTSLEKVMSLDPEDYRFGESSQLLGGQANVWTERMPDFETVKKMLFPRVYALAEIFWSGRAHPDLKERISKLEGYL